MGKKAGLILLIATLVPVFAYAQRISVFKMIPPTAGGNVGVQPSVWSDNTNTRAVWFLEEDGTTNRVSQKDNSVMELAESASISRSSTFQQGTYSNDLTGTPYLQCTHATCGSSTQLGIQGNYTAGCWAQPDVTSNLRRIMAKGTSTTTVNSTGYMVARTSSSTLQCENTTTESISSANSFPVSTWTHAVCRYDGTNIRPLINGVVSGSNVAAGAPGATTTPFRIGARADNTSTNQTWDGLLDECFVVASSLTDGQICRIARCGFDGEFCVCDDSPTTAYKPCVSNWDCRDYSVYGTCNLTDGTCSGRSISCTPSNCDDTGP